MGDAADMVGIKNSLGYQVPALGAPKRGLRKYLSIRGLVAVSLVNSSTFPRTRGKLKMLLDLLEVWPRDFTCIQ